MSNFEHGGRKVRRMPQSATLWLLLSTVVTLSGCAHSAERRREVALSELQHSLSGVYTSSSASSAASAAGSATEGADAGVSLTILPVTSQLIGDAVYFVRETPANNAGLALWEGVWTLAPAAAAHGREHDRDHGEPRIVQHGFLFKDARRWASASSDPDLLVSMLPQDLQALAGCDLVWRKTATGFETEGPLRACHPGSQASGLWVEQQARLEGGELFLTERLVNEVGALDLRGPPLLLHLTRTGAPP